MGYLDQVKAEIILTEDLGTKRVCLLWPFPPGHLSLEASFARWIQHGVGWLAPTLTTANSYT